jgi:glutamate:Na+ symporter, ESS family
MEMLDGALQVGPFLAVTLGIIVLFAGKRLNDAIGFLREFSIPEPVTGGCCSPYYLLSSMPFL